MISQVTIKLQLTCFKNDEQPRRNPRAVRNDSASDVTNYGKPVENRNLKKISCFLC